MKGAGYYDQHSTAQQASIRALQDWIAEAIATMPLPAAPQPVTVLDLGSSEGRNAVLAMRAIVAGLRQRTGQSLQVIYSDLASNNFNRLFANLDQAQRAGRFPAGVYSSAVGGSFYGPLLPPGTVHLATSFNALHWLDQLPAAALDDSVVYQRPRPGFPASAQTASAFRRQAEQDLVRFLKSRARELVSGGKLLVAGPGDTSRVRVSDGFADVLNDACLDLLAVGRLAQAQYQRLILPCYFRTVGELLAPLYQEDSPLRGTFAVDRAKALEVPPPFVTEFRRSGDVAAYAAAYTGFLRAVTEPVVKAAFNQPHGNTVECLYERVYARLLDQPEHYVFRYILVAALLTRR
jgi:hypothetical protein